VLGRQDSNSNEIQTTPAAQDSPNKDILNSSHKASTQAQPQPAYNSTRSTAHRQVLVHSDPIHPNRIVNDMKKEFMHKSSHTIRMKKTNKERIPIFTDKEQEIIYQNRCKDCNLDFKTMEP
jgi:hypothetical protein